jgi:hypothetical protein
MDNEIRTADVQYADDLRPASAGGPPAAAPPQPAPGTSAPAAAPGSTRGAAPPSLAVSATPAQVPPASGAPNQFSSGTITAVSLLLVGAAFIGIGEWGRRSLDDLVPAGLPPEKRARKRRSLRRGVITSLAGGGAMIALALWGVVVTLTG